MSAPDKKDLPLYYRYTAPKLLSDISFRTRKKIFRVFMDVMRPGPNERVLDVGATRVSNRQESNFFEQFYPYPERLTGVGVEDMVSLKAAYPSASFLQIRPEEPLPFADKEFDVAFSNAVLEHVGDAQRQRAFVKEVTRVSRRGLISIPDRRFPIEHHSALPVIHWMPGGVYRALFRLIGYKELGEVDHLNHLWKSEFQSLFDPKLRFRSQTVKTMGWPSNLLGFYWSD